MCQEGTTKLFFMVNGIGCANRRIVQENCPVCAKYETKNRVNLCIMRMRTYQVKDQQETFVPVFKGPSLLEAKR
jgi:hypothetical protein